MKLVNLRNQIISKGNVGVSFMEDLLEPMQKIMLVSNREPYIHEKKNGEITVKRSVGGLVTALDPLIQEQGGTWVAWGSGSADFDVCDDTNKVKVPPETKKYLLKRIPLSEEEEKLFYRGYANSVLWPLFHIFIEKIKIKDDFWNAYYNINKRFANSILEELDEHTLLWIHDYHLALVPSFIREQFSEAKIAYFWHIPWPPWEVFGTLPQRDEIMTGLLNTDLLGFHTKSYVENFINCCKKKARTKIENNYIHLNNHETKVISAPLGIKYESYAHDIVDNNQIRKEKRKLKKAYDVDSIILGLDRLDYTKGILNRLKSFEYFLQMNPEFHEKVILVQIATPSRYEIDEYHKMKKNIDETVGRINAKFRTANWTPVKYFFRYIPQNLLLAYYQISDIALLTPIRDGMNLIAKEYIAAREEHAVLILSEFAGASEELNEAIIVNPYDIISTADALKTAITMPPEEKKNRFHELKRKVQEKDASWWLDSFIKEWKERYQIK